MEIAETGYYHTKSSVSQLYSSFGGAEPTVTERAFEDDENKEVSLTEAVKDIDIVAVEETDEGFTIIPDEVVEKIVDDELDEASVDIPSGDDDIAIADKYDPNQSELVEIAQVPIDSEPTEVVAKDVKLELGDPSSSSDGDDKTVQAEGDLGQSDPEDSDMYSTRS